MRRREFIATSSGMAFAWPLGASGLQRRLGVAGTGREGGPVDRSPSLGTCLRDRLAISFTILACADEVIE
jgi:hypothetical protein